VAATRGRLENLEPSAFRQLREDSAGKGRVFIGERGLPLKKPRYWWEAAVEEAKLEDFHWHDLRHCFASSLVMAGVDLRTVAQLLGHRTLQMVMRYSHLSQSHELAAVERLCKTDEGSEKQSDTRSDTSHKKAIRKVA
jgi:site-specific recombinase XerD